MSVQLSGSLVITGSIFATQGITGSFSGSATSASYADTLQGLGSASFAPAGTFNTVSQSFATTSGSIASRVNVIETSYATTGSNNFTKPQQISDVSNAISFTSTASLYTDGGLRVKGSSFVSGTAYFNDVVVYGTSSIEYITSSQLAIGTNIITLNTDTPSIRFGGISVFDSGSNNLSTGSLFWDSEKDKWIYSNPSASTYDGGMLISGPRNTSGLGNEVGTTSCALMMGQGGDHITSSAIFSYGNATCFYGNSYISSTGTSCFAGSIQGSTLYGTATVCSATICSAGNIRGTRLSLGTGVCTNPISIEDSSATSTNISLFNTIGTAGATAGLQLGIANGTLTTGAAAAITTRGLTAADAALDFKVLYNYSLVCALTLGSNGAATFSNNITAGGRVYGTTTGLNSDFNAGGLISYSCGSTLRYTQVGFDCIGNYGWIQALEQGVAYRNLVLNGAGGNVGINTTSPSTLLHLNSTSTQLTLQNTDGGTNAERIGMYMTSGDTFKILSLCDNNTTRVDNILVANVLTGNVGIGTASPEGVLTIKGTSSQPSNSGTTANSLLQIVGSLNNEINVGLNTVSGCYGAYIQVNDNNLAVNYPLNLQPNGGQVSIGTYSTSTEANLFLGAQGSTEGGQLVLQKGTSYQCATHLDNYTNQFRILSGTDTTTTAAHMIIDHTTKNACFYGAVTSTSRIIGNGFRSYSGDISIASGATSTIYTMSDNGLYTVQIIVAGGSLIYSAAAIFYAHSSNSQFVKTTDLYDGSNVTLDNSGGAIRITNGGFTTLTWNWSILFQAF